MAMEQDYGRFSYKFKSDDDVAVGSLILIVNNARMNLSALILEKQYVNQEDLYEYVCKGYSQNTSAVTARNIKLFSGVPIVIIPPKYKGRIEYVGS